MKRRVTAISWRVMLLACLCSALPALAPAQTEQEKARSQLEQLNAEIKRIAAQITTDTNRQDKLQSQLREAEKKLGELQRDIRTTRDELKAGKKELAALEQQRSEQEAARDAQQSRIALEMRNAWKTGQQGQVRLLLNQEDPHTVARSMAYYRYVFRARNELLEEYRATLRQLEELQVSIDTTVAKLQAREESLQEQRAELSASQSSRKNVLAELASDIENNNSQLAEKEKDRGQLEDLLRSIEKVIDIPVPKDYQAFKSARGKMPWPVAGKPSNQFNRPRNQGKMRWQGLTIPAEEGTTVSAIHHGRIVYADWLRGSGLLLIIDHGDGYMSLYAHNESLLRDVGEWVAAGDPVSTVGNTGGAQDHALYFEIRHDGKPVNPSKWCKG